MDSEKLSGLIKTASKHSDYQRLHPLVCGMIDDAYQPSGKAEVERQTYMQEHLPLAGARILDIGANTGYFSFAALHADASHVTAYEGNIAHANFMAEAAREIGLDERIDVFDKYFDFSETSEQHYDTALCLNVLHHVGDDFGDQKIDMAAAKTEIIRSLRTMAKRSQWMWFQLGFNWKGDRQRPLFKNGLKVEMMDFIDQACGNAWSMARTAIFNPATSTYEDRRDSLMPRFDQIGEFLNRPLFLLKSHAFDC